MSTTDTPAWKPAGITGTDEPAHTPSKGKAQAIRPLNRRQRAFIAELVSNPTQPASRAYSKAYGTTDKLTARVSASKALKRKAVQLELAKYNDNAKAVLLDVMQYANEYGKGGGHIGSAYTGHALQAANSIIDRVDGKAVTRVEQRSEVVSISIDLTGVAGE